MGGEHAAHPSPMPMTRFHSLRVAEVRRLTPDAVAISFAVPDDLRPVFAFMPGQYLTLRATIDGEDIRRCYSLCSTPDAPLLTVGVKQVEGGAFSTFANQSLKVGDVLEVMAPEGRFALPGDQPGRHALAIVAGSGITPVLSIAARLLASDAAARFTLIYGNRTSASVMFAEEIEDLKDRYLERVAVTYVLSREPQDSPLLNGRIDGERLRAFAAGSIDLKSIDDVLRCRAAGRRGDRHQARRSCPSCHDACLRRKRDRRRGARGHRSPLFLQGRHVLHLSLSRGFRRSRDGGQLFARALGTGIGFPARLSVDAKDGHAFAGFRSDLEPSALSEKRHRKPHETRSVSWGLAIRDRSALPCNPPTNASRLRMGRHDAARLAIDAIRFQPSPEGAAAGAPSRPPRNWARSS